MSRQNNTLLKFNLDMFNLLNSDEERLEYLCSSQPDSIYETGSLDAIKMFVRKISHSRDENNNYFHILCIRGFDDAVKYVLSLGNISFYKTNDGMNPVEILCFYGHYKLVKFICDNYYDFTEQGCDKVLLRLLYFTCKNIIRPSESKINIIKYFVDIGVKNNYFNKSYFDNGYSKNPIYLLCCNSLEYNVNNMDLINYFISNGFSLTYKHTGIFNYSEDKYVINYFLKFADCEFILKLGLFSNDLVFECVLPKTSSYCYDKEKYIRDKFYEHKQQFFKQMKSYSMMFNKNKNYLNLNDENKIRFCVELCGIDYNFTYYSYDQMKFAIEHLYKINKLDNYISSDTINIILRNLSKLDEDVLEIYNPDDNTKNKQIVLMNKHLDLIKYFLERITNLELLDLPKVDKLPRLIERAFNFDFYKYIVERMKFENILVYSDSFIFASIKNDCTESFGYVLDLSYDNFLDHTMGSILSKIVDNNKYDMMKLLLEKDFNINKTCVSITKSVQWGGLVETNWNDVIDYIGYKNHVEMLKYIFEYYADKNCIESIKQIISNVAYKIDYSYTLIQIIEYICEYIFSNNLFDLFEFTIKKIVYHDNLYAFKKFIDTINEKNPNEKYKNCIRENIKKPEMINYFNKR